jgi:hypothetical protein
VELKIVGVVGEVGIERFLPQHDLLLDQSTRQQINLADPLHWDRIRWEPQWLQGVLQQQPSIRHRSSGINQDKPASNLDLISAARAPVTTQNELRVCAARSRRRRPVGRTRGVEQRSSTMEILAWAAWPSSHAT